VRERERRERVRGSRGRGAYPIGGVQSRLPGALGSQVAPTDRRPQEGAHGHGASHLLELLGRQGGGGHGSGALPAAAASPLLHADSRSPRYSLHKVCYLQGCQVSRYDVAVTLVGSYELDDKSLQDLNRKCGLMIRGAVILPGYREDTL